MIPPEKIEKNNIIEKNFPVKLNEYYFVIITLFSKLILRLVASGSRWVTHSGMVFGVSQCDLSKKSIQKCGF